MPLPNRVTPFGALEADPARGTVMGNRGGMFHDPVARSLTGRRWASRRWLCCSLDYPGSHRHPVWSRGYTQLFFLDEVTALSAGHRPCAECRRVAAFAFLAAAGGPASLAELDARLHGERLDGRIQRHAFADAAHLPAGAVILHQGSAWALQGRSALRWNHAGYDRAIRRPAGQVAVLTPATTIRALAAGYRPLWHPTASGAEKKAGNRAPSRLSS